VPRFMDYHDYLNLPAEAIAQMAMKMSPGYIRQPPDVGVGQARVLTLILSQTIPRQRIGEQDLARDGVREPPAVDTCHAHWFPEQQTIRYA